MRVVPPVTLVAPVTLLAVLAATLVAAAPARAWTTPPAGSSTAVAGNVLNPGTALFSAGQRFKVVMQGDGNLVLYGWDGSALWSSRTSGPGNRTWLQADGNVVVRTPAGAPLWATGTDGRGASIRLVVQGDGNLVLYTGSTAVWQTRTARTATAPLGYSGNATQVVAVAAPSATSTTAAVSGWTRTSTGWTNTLAAVGGFVGAAGVGAASEGSSKTPAGTYTLTQSFGRIANPGTRLPWFTTDTLDWWDENPASPTYNLHVRRTTSPGGASENLYRTGTAYDAAVVIDYNTARTPGAGSGFFLHVSTGSPTAGCVSVPAANVVAILRWLNPSAHPAIRIAVS